ncbi:DUF3089 domain-containing protein [Actinokineospora spheciospongiae]|uniref:DUF3089 domain-containing protein n=1 Tax=Actinokineospora spheciospongiae TaxID=909613 RepID=UPI000D70FE57|nr:DUF3089 domain-containing protein [Actinokineospora spheciospongiae]PWW59396.1 hypothetical protein DFQ13_10833 [Actinokineospora spheciospongiae]
MRIRLTLAAAAVLAAATTAAVVVAEPGTASAAEPLARTVWLCKPGLTDNLCGQALDGTQDRAPHYPNGRAVNLDASTMSADDRPVGVEPFAPGGPKPVDCFYVYPTVDALPNPLVQAGNVPPERREEGTAVTLAQVARFTHHCRVFAPSYRQIPLAGLLGGVTGPDRERAALDVRTAFEDYWAHDNVDPATGERRGVVLLGHSQGTFVLTDLIKAKFDGPTPERDRLISAYLLGGSVQVPVSAGDQDNPGASFRTLRPCASTTERGCLVGYSAFAVEQGQSPGAMFAGNLAPGVKSLCVNPAALLAGAPADATTPIDPYLPTRTLLKGNPFAHAGPLSLILTGVPVPDLKTGFAHYPGDGQGGCRFTGDETANRSWMQVDASPKVAPPQSGATSFGLHVGDYNLLAGDLDRLLGAQVAAWRG